MPKNKMSKRLLTGVMAAAMSASALTAGMTSLTVFAGQELGHGDFNDNAGLPWHICESATGTMKFEITDGCYNILITNPGGLSENGEGRWDCQFRHRGLTIESGHKYRITYSVWTDDSDAKIYAKIGDMTDDDKELWHGDGEILNLKYSDVEGKDMADIESALKNASTTGQRIDYGMGWNAWKDSSLPSNTWTTYAYEFTPDKTAEGVGEWTFHLGGTSEWNDFICVHEGKVIKFDNMCLIDMTDDKSDYVHEAEYVATGVEVNQVGYFTKLAKKATLVLGDTPDTTPKTFQVKNSSGATVYEGTTTGGGTLCDASNTYNQVIDFSDFQEEGTGYTVVCDGKTSKPFDIGNKIYGNLTTEAMNYFYQNRSGVEIEAKYIASADTNPDVPTAKASASDLARAAGHTKDVAYVQSKWVYIIPTDADCETSQSIDVSGGWYDAGDHGKYVVNGGVSIWTLLSMFDRDVNKGDISKWDDAGKTVVVPEAGNNIPDILDEVQWEIDFFKKMQDPADGMVYHKIHDYKWTALAVSPEAATKRTAAGELTRIIKPKTYAATLNFAAALAQYSRLIAPYDKNEADECATLAAKAYKAAKDCYKPYVTVPDQNADHTSLYAPLTQNKGGGPYGDTNVTDEFYWAACELYITTGEASYKTDMMSYNDKSGKYFEVPTVLYGGENNGTCSAFTWGTVGSLGTLSLSINGKAMVDKGLLTADELTTIQNSVKSAADYYLKLEEESDFGVPYVGHDYETTVWTLKEGEVKKTLKNGYEWGSNSMVINNAMVMGLAYDIDREVKYISGVSTAMDYLFGRNLLEFSYISGYGEHHLNHPHHRWWSHDLDATYPSAPVGVLSGGNNSEMQDPMIQGKGYKAGEVAPMLCYIDSVEAWSVNECTINWNSPLVWISSFLEDEAENVDGTTASKQTTTATTTTTTSSSNGGETTTTTSNGGQTTTTTKVTPGDVLIGDTNLDGAIGVVDIVYLNKYLAKSVSFNAQQLANAACVSDEKIDSNDAIALLKYTVKKITSLPVTP